MEFDDTGYGIHNEGKYWHRHCRIAYYKDLQKRRVDRMSFSEIEKHIQVMIGLAENNATTKR